MSWTHGWRTVPKVLVVPLHAPVTLAISLPSNRQLYIFDIFSCRTSSMILIFQRPCLNDTVVGYGGRTLN